jgi:hypothetical protein
MECADDVEVAAGRIAVKSDEYDIAEDRRNDNQPGVGVGTRDRLAIDKENVFLCEMGLPKAGAIAGVKLGVLEVPVRDGARISDEFKDGACLAIVLISLGPFFGARET